MRLLNLLPPVLHRLAFRIGHRLRSFWYARTRKTVHGATVLAHDREGRFLLVRHSYGPAVWAFPSGGMRKDETPLVAALREFREEVSCDLVDVRRLATVKENYLGATNVVHVYSGLIDGEPQADRREIVEAGLFEREAFPANLSRTVPARMAAFDAAQAEAPAWHRLQQR